MLEDERLMYRLPDAQRVLGLGRSTMYELIRSGKIESVTVGRARLIPRAALVRFVSELHEQTPASQPAA